MGIGLIGAVAAGSLFLAPMLKGVPSTTVSRQEGPIDPQARTGGLVNASDDFVEIVLNQELAKETSSQTPDTPLLRPMRSVAQPAAPLERGQTGFVYGPGYAVNIDRTTIAIDELIASGSGSAAEDVSYVSAYFEPNKSCSLSRVKPGRKPVSVLVGAPYQYAPVRLFDRSQVVEVLAGSAKESLKEGYFPSAIPVDRGQMGLVNVVVTDTEAPLHLILQNRQHDILWNITSAKGVEIAHIALVGPRSSGVAGDVGKATIESVRATDYHELVGRTWRDSVVKDGCMAQPHARPSANWGASHNAAVGSRKDAELLTRMTGATKAYYTWFQSRTGVPVETNFLTADKATVVLVGPKPSAPLQGRALHKSVLHLPQNDYVLTGTNAALEAATQRIYSEILDAAAGGTYTWPLAKDLVLSPDDAAAQRVDPVRDRVKLGLGFVDGRQEIREKNHPEAINDERRAIFSVEVSFRDLLKPGEAMPSDDLLPIYAHLRGAKYMERYCEDTLPEMATRCGIVKHSARLLQGGKVAIRTTFGFVQNYDVGPLKVRNGGGFISAFLPVENLNKKFSTPEQRRALISRYLKVCDQLRQEYGNCMLGTLSFNLSRPAKFTSGARAHATGWVEVYALDQPLVKKKFEARAKELFTQIRN